MANQLKDGMNAVIVSHYNHSGKWDKSRGGGACKTALLLFICVLIVLENVTVLLTLWRNKRFHSRMYFLIGNLALSDLLAGVVYTANILLSGANTYKLTPTQWFIREGSMFVALAASVFSLLAIAIERHLTMLQMKLHNNGNTCRVFLLISAVWMVAAVLGGLPVMGWNCIRSVTSCSTVLPLYHKTYILFCTTVFSIILMAIVVLYARIYALVRARSRRLVFRKPTNGRGSAGANMKSSEKSMALLKTVIIVLSCFIACWAPLFILLLLDAGCETLSCPILYKAEWFLSLAVLNSAMNPLIYTLTSNEMRRAFLKTLLCCTACLRPKAKSSGPIMGAEFSRSRSDNSSHPNKEEAEYSPRVTTSGRLTSSS